MLHWIRFNRGLNESAGIDDQLSHLRSLPPKQHHWLNPPQNKRLYNISETYHSESRLHTSSDSFHLSWSKWNSIPGKKRSDTYHLWVHDTNVSSQQSTCCRMKGQNFFSGRRELQNRTSPLAYELKCSCARKTPQLPCSFFLLFVCLPTRHDSENSFKCFHAFQIELKFESVGFSGGDKTWVPGENPFGARMRTNNKLNPQMASTPGNKPAPHWWEASALITGPSLLHSPPPPLS